MQQNIIALVIVSLPLIDSATASNDANLQEALRHGDLRFHDDFSHGLNRDL